MTISAYPGMFRHLFGMDIIESPDRPRYTLPAEVMPGVPWPPGEKGTNVRLTDEQIDAVFNAMPGGAQGFCKDWGGYACDAEEAAEIICGVPADSHPLIAALQAGNRERFDIKKLSEESFEQFVGMVRNWRACGYLHPMDFNRKVWGTKWNACRPKAEPEEGRCEFETAWSCPTGVLVKVSERFPDDTITVTYADEDIGSNCGTFTLKAGQIVEQDIAPSWRDLDDAGKEKWKAFAYQVNGREPETEDEEA